MNILVTGGGTIAPIDDVRRIANVSSGRFAAEITEACLDQGANVWHVHPLSALLPIHRQAVIDLEAPEADEVERIAKLQKKYHACRERLHLIPQLEGTVGEYEYTVKRVLRTWPIDIIFLVAAVSDFEPEPQSGKLSSDADELVIRCRPTPKVIRSVREWAPDAFLVGFKLLSRVPTDELIATARTACAVNRADLTVANDLQTVVAGEHRVHLVRPNDQAVVTLGPDEVIAPGLVEHVFDWAREAIGNREPIAFDEEEE